MKSLQNTVNYYLYKITIVENMLHNFSMRIYKHKSNEILQEYQLNKLKDKVSFVSKESKIYIKINS